jgi:hypothetical protein
MTNNSVFGLLRVCYENNFLKETNHTSIFGGVKNAFLLSESKLTNFLINLILFLSKKYFL